MLNILDQRADSLGISRKTMVNVLLGKILLSNRTFANSVTQNARPVAWQPVQA
jgi:hypothetical protein